MPTGMSSKRTFMYLAHQQPCFCLVHTSEQDCIKISFVKYVLIEEELTSQSSESFLVSVRCTRWILLILKELLDIIKPWLVVSDRLGSKHISGPLKAPNTDLGYFIAKLHLIHGTQGS